MLFYPLELIVINIVVAICDRDPYILFEIPIWMEEWNGGAIFVKTSVKHQSSQKLSKIRSL